MTKNIVPYRTTSLGYGEWNGGEKEQQQNFHFIVDEDCSITSEVDKGLHGWIQPSSVNTSLPGNILSCVKIGLLVRMCLHAA